MIDLYITENCPYSRKVMDFCDENNIKYSKFDINYRENLEKLLELGGLHQVPFMYDEKNHTKLYESDDIIAYLKNMDK